MPLTFRSTLDLLEESKYEIQLSSQKIIYSTQGANAASYAKNKSKPYAGSFKVLASETVYIGNFALDCFQNPSLWRYYSENQEDFQKQLGDYKAKYPFLDLSSVKYRLFETNVISQAHELK